MNRELADLVRRVNTSLSVGPSVRLPDWNTILNAAELDMAALNLITSEEPDGVWYYELKSYISGWRPGCFPTSRRRAAVKPKHVAAVSKYFEDLHLKIGPAHRHLDIGW